MKYSFAKPRTLLATVVILGGRLSVAWADSPYASTVVSSTGYPASPGLYTDPSAVLGKPTTQFVDLLTDDVYRTNLYSAAFNRDPANNPTITTVLSNQSITVAFDHDVRNDAGNPYGVDLLVFGNSFFSTSAAPSPTTDPRTLTITAGVNSEPLTVSVAQSLAGPWYTFSNTNADGLFPTQSNRWNSAAGTWGPESDFTKPVNPALSESSFVGLSADQAIGLYDGSGGGAGFDLAGSGFDWIRYVRITGDGGEIDAISDVAPVPEPTSMASGAVLVLGLLARRRRNSR